MGYTTPTTRASGYIVTAAAWNTDLVENIKFLANPPACRVTHNTTQSLNDAVETTVSFNTERFDTNSMHDTVTNNSRITINTAGIYVVGFHGQFAAANDYVNGYGILRLNGTTYISLAGSDQSVVGISDFQVCTTTLYKFAVNDYIEVRALQNNTASAARNLQQGTAFSPEFWAVWVGLG